MAAPTTTLLRHLLLYAALAPVCADCRAGDAVAIALACVVALNAAVGVAVLAGFVKVARGRRLAELPGVRCEEAPPAVTRKPVGKQLKLRKKPASPRSRPGAVAARRNTPPTRLWRLRGDRSGLRLRGSQPESPEETIYECDNGCGFLGPYEACVAHEAACTFVPREEKVEEDELPGDGAAAPSSRALLKETELRQIDHLI